VSCWGRVRRMVVVVVVVCVCVCVGGGGGQVEHVWYT
jgi:hypothetical protein